MSAGKYRSQYSGSAIDAAIQQAIENATKVADLEDSVSSLANDLTAIVDENVTARLQNAIEVVEENNQCTLKINLQ